MPGVYAADGSINVTVVDGTTITGLYAPDGSWNVVVSDGVDHTGVYHPCGAYWVTVLTEGPEGILATDGSLFVQEAPYTYSGGFRVTVVSGSLSGFSLTAPDATWISDAATAQAVFEIIVDDDVVSGDKIWGESSTDNFATILETVSAAISAGDLVDLQIDDFAFSPFTPDGTYYVRFWVSNSADVQRSAKSNVISEAIVTATAPVNTVAPVISGNTQVGETLTTTDGTWTGTATINFTYQWKRGAGNIGGATANTYVLTEADAGQSITCVVTGTNGVGNSTGTSNALVVDVYLLYLGHAELATDVAEYTFSSKDLGTVAANRKIVVTGGHRDAGGGVTPSITVEGNAATSLLARVSGTHNCAFLQIIDDVTNETGDIVVTIGVGSLRCGISWYAIYGAGSSTPSDTGTDFDTTATVLSDTLTVPSKGVGIGCICGNAAGAYTIAWTTPLALDHTTGIESNVIHSSGSVNSNAGGSILFEGTWSSAPIGSGAVFASWGP